MLIYPFVVLLVIYATSVSIPDDPTAAEHALTVIRDASLPGETPC